MIHLIVDFLMPVIFVTLFFIISQDSGFIKINLGDLLDQMITEDMGTGSDYPFFITECFIMPSTEHLVSS